LIRGGMACAPWRSIAKPLRASDGLCDASEFCGIAWRSHTAAHPQLPQRPALAVAFGSVAAWQREHERSCQGFVVERLENLCGSCASKATPEAYLQVVEIAFVRRPCHAPPYSDLAYNMRADLMQPL
jgi:urease accessory protein UreF